MFLKKMKELYKKNCIFVAQKLKDNATMVTLVKKTQTKANTNVDVDVRCRIKPRGLVGMFKGRIILNGTDEEVFSLNRLEKVR